MKVVRIIAAAVAMTAGVALADNVDVVSVKGKGVGTDETAALQEAYRDAIETAVGLYVDAEQMVKNDEVIKDQILTQSNAYIEKYDMISKNEKDGLVSIKIISKVRKQALTKRIEGVMPAKVMNIGDQLSSLHAQATTQKMRGKDAAAILAKELVELDRLKQLYEVELASAEGVPMSVRNGVVEDKNGIVEMEYLFRISLNAKRYFDEVVPRLDRVLAQISIEEPKALRFKVEHLNRVVANPCMTTLGRVAVENETTRRYAVAPYLGMDRQGAVGEFKFSSGASERNPSKSMIGLMPSGQSGLYEVRLITQVNDALTVVRGKRYVIDAECKAEYEKWARRGDDGWASLSKRMSLPPFVVTFVDGEGQPITESEIQFADKRDSANALVCESFGNSWDITPWVGLSAKSYCRWFTFKLPKDDLPKIKSIKVEVAN